ncbi:hypothetical protein MRX96_012286 [Rhipicephalus microplus]
MAPKQLASGQTRTDYYCNGSGVARPKEGYGKRQEKSQSTCKSGKICLSFLTVTKQENTQSPAAEGIGINVRYQKKHYGHQAEIQHLRMTDEEKANIAEHLERGVPMKTVLKNIKTSVASKLRPARLAERVTLHNIKRQFHIAAPEQCHPNDAVSVDMWVQAMREKGETLVRLYKAQGAVDPNGTFGATDFALALMREPQKELEELDTGTVCLDSTHGTTGYQFELTTLLVLDKVGSASEMSQASHIIESITKLDTATKVSSAALFKAKMESFKQAIVDDEVVEKANKLFEPVLQLVEGNKKRKMPDQSNEPANKKVKRQVRFYSTKEPRSSQLSPSLSKPTEAQKEVLRQQLINRNVESAQIITPAGHDYS